MAHGYIAHVGSRKNEALSKQRDPKKKARRWVVEACHSWFNRFWRLLVRYEKLEHTFLWPSTTSLLPASPCTKSTYPFILFTDRS
jgi:hypothetical protein